MLKMFKPVYHKLLMSGFIAKFWTFDGIIPVIYKTIFFYLKECG